MSYDVIVIGAGPGGYVAAIRAAQLGGKVLLVEKDRLGGVCLNRGCIPTKTLLKSADKWRELQHCGEFGLKAGEIGFDFTAVAARRDAVVAQLRGGVEQLVKSNDIEIKYGTAQLRGGSRVTIQEQDGSCEVEGKAIILATGSSPVALPVPGGDLPGVINSDHLLAMNHVPASMLVIGAGAVGIEFAAIYQAFGCDVTVVEMMPGILPNLDSDIVKRAGLALRKQGLKMLTNTKVTGIAAADGLLNVTVDNGKGTQQIVVENVLMAAGRRANTTGLGLEDAGVAVERSGIPVNDRLETNVPRIYAIGDVTGRMMWAHAASAAGVVAAENAMGGHSQIDFRAVAGGIFTTPEIAMVGLTEQEAGPDIKVGRFNFAANGKAVSLGETDGLVKIIADAATDKVVGVHIMGPHASDLIMEGALAIQHGLTASQLAHTIHPHPTLCETVGEAAHGVNGDIIHQVKMKPRR
ncbi:MAG TPA: dihydrolipoyl dehydrogenase [Patescibacteria group bacterium]|nr:dihydrolipoyl dehydrogenase [Patescibacteria group bacterium]